MAETTPEDATGVFEFTVLRSAAPVPERSALRHFVHDRALHPVPVAPAGAIAGGGEAVRRPALTDASPVARAVFELVYCKDLKPGPQAEEALLEKLLELPLFQARVPCAPPGGGGVLPLTLEEAQRTSLLYHKGQYYVGPDNLQQVAERFDAAQQQLLGQVLRARADLAEDAANHDRARLRSRLHALFQLQAGEQLASLVFAANNDVASYSAPFAQLRRTLFDLLYVLYLLRRHRPIDLDPVMSALTTMHALEAIAVEALIESAAPPSATQRALLNSLSYDLPPLQRWSGQDVPPELAIDGDVLRELMSAIPVIHPIFAQVFWHRHPFNDIRPIGVGDLKIVKQWLTKYRRGEISHVHNIMKGEVNKRDHRRLERSEAVFTYSTARVEDKTRDKQSTDRFELKTEAESVARTSLSAKADASLTYKRDLLGGILTATAGGGIAYERANETHTRGGQNFARDVIAKAVDRIETRSSTNQSTTEVFETEEKHGQEFNNVNGKSHISGIYRWLDKVYEAQVFNYGKRKMFEFVVPEPGTSWVETKLYQHNARLRNEVPRRPFPEPQLAPVNLGFTLAEINWDKYRQLRAQYDLSGCPPYPGRGAGRWVALRNIAGNDLSFAEAEVKEPGGNDYFTKGYAARADGLTGQVATRVRYRRAMRWEKFDAPGNSDHLVSVFINGVLGKTEAGKGQIWTSWTPEGDLDHSVILDSDEVMIDLSFNSKLDHYAFEFIQLWIETPESSMEQWQDCVYGTVYSAESQRARRRYEEELQAYNAAMAAYRNKIDAIKATPLAEVIASAGSGANEVVIREELKRHCMTMLTKEFDTNVTDDVLARETTVGKRDLTSKVSRLLVDESDPGKDEATTVEYTTNQDLATPFTAIDIDASRRKGTVVQFLETAFEWSLISYIFYPYFWAPEERWVELKGRVAGDDSTFTSFLQSGMARVLLAVTPGFEDAVDEYLATRRPWQGGAQPVIGEPLFMALHDELRRTVDDREKATPEGEPWSFTLPTSLVYLHDSGDEVPDLAAERGEEAPASGAGGTRGRRRNRRPGGRL